MSDTFLFMKVSAIIAAGGIGKRMGSSGPKQYIELLGKPIICHTLDRFREVPEITEVVITVPSGFVNSFVEEIIRPYNYPADWRVTQGGTHRQDSVRNGLALVSSDCDIVVVHDGVRPFITPRLIKKSIEVASSAGAVIVAAPIKETIKRVGLDLDVEETVNRKNLWGAQTPQTFRASLLREAVEVAYKNNFLGTDDASLVERLGIKVRVIEGDSKNIKITTPDDLVVASAIARSW